MPSTTPNYKKITSLEERKQKSHKMTVSYPDRIPVIVEMSASSASYQSYIAASHKVKYLVPYELTMGQFIFVIRKRISLSSDKALFVFCNNSLPTTGSLMRELYSSHGDSDGFLYMTYCGENTFGSWS